MSNITTFAGVEHINQTLKALDLRFVTFFSDTTVIEPDELSTRTITVKLAVPEPKPELIRWP